MKRNVFVLLSLVLCLGILMTGCSSGTNAANATAQSKTSVADSTEIIETTSTTESESNNKITIGFSQCVMNHPFRIAMVESAKKFAAENPNVELLVTDGQGDVNKEIANIESFIARKVDAIVVSSLSGQAIYPAYQQVADANIPLIIAASGAPDDNTVPYTSFVSTDEVIMGQKAADYVTKLMGGKGNLVIINGVPESTNSMYRTKGFMPEIEKSKDINIVAEQSGEWLRLTAMQVMTNILQANPKIDCVFTQNDEMAFGCLEAIKNAGRTGEMKIVSCDAQKEALKMIKDGNTDLVMTVKNEWNTADAMKAAVDAVQGKEIPKRIVQDCPVVDASNIDQYFDPDAIF